MSVLFPDAGGFRPAQAGDRAGAAGLRNPRPLARLVEAAREAGVRAAPSRNAGSYLCNYIYWRALEAARTAGGPRLVAFVHVPPVKRKPRPSSANGAAVSAGRSRARIGSDPRRHGGIGTDAAACHTRADQVTLRDRCAPSAAPFG